MSSDDLAVSVRGGSAAEQGSARRDVAVERLVHRLATAATPEEAAAARAQMRQMEAELQNRDVSVVDLERYAVVTRLGH